MKTIISYFLIVFCVDRLYWTTFSVSLCIWLHSARNLVEPGTQHRFASLPLGYSCFLLKKLHCYYYYSVCVYILWCACECGYAGMIEHIWKSEDNLWELVTFFYHLDSGYHTHILRFCGKYFYWLSHLAL